MDLNRVAPELRASARRMPPVPIHNALVRWALWHVLGALPHRAFPGVNLTRHSGAGVGIRLYEPEVRRGTGALLWIHGGGLVIGRASMDDAFCAATARDLGVVIASIDYRLAPRHPYPLPLDDCAQAWEWLQSRATTLGIDPTRVAVGGQSAGGGLAAALAQRLADGDGPHPVAQWLFCPMLDDRTASMRDLDAERHFAWDNHQNYFGWRAYLGTEPGTPALPPYASPGRREDLSGLAPAWIGVGDIDLFSDEAVAYARRLMASGVETTLDVVPGAPHGFESWAPNTALSRAYVARARSWLEAAVGAKSAP